MPEWGAESLNIIYGLLGLIGVIFGWIAVEFHNRVKRLEEERPANASDISELKTHMGHVLEELRKINRRLDP